MLFARFISVIRRIASDDLYRAEMIQRFRQKARNGTLYSWLLNNGKRHFKSYLNAVRLPIWRSHDHKSSQDFINAVKFNQQPHPDFHTHRTRHIAQSSLQNDSLRFIAFYLPQFHPLDVNNSAWGEGFTEWTNTSKALPQFEGHYQPHLPADLGYYDLRLPAVMYKQIDIAKSHGVHGFCFHYYWFDDHKVMDTPLKTFLKTPDMEQFFCICWANENWTRRWDGMESEIILEQRYSSDNFLKFFIDILPFINDPRYITVDGKPLLIVYRPQLIPNLQNAIHIWREQALQSGLPGIWLVCAQVFGLTDPYSIGFDAAVEFPPHKINDVIKETSSPNKVWHSEYKGRSWNYSDVVAESFTRIKEAYPLYRCVFPSWDNEARRPASGHTYLNASPPQFGEWLATCISYTNETRSSAEHFVFINAWNEWAEGAHLEPDRHFGYAWLDQIAHQNDKIALSSFPQLSFAVPLSISPKYASIAVVVHIYYEETWPEIALALQSMPEPFDLIVTTCFEKSAEVSKIIKNTFSDAEVYTLENRGRDIRPFLAILPLLIQREYKAALKLHSKKTVHRKDGDFWRKTQINQLLPSNAELASMINSIDKYPSLGIIAPEGNILNIQHYLGSNKEWLEKLIKELGEKPQWLEQVQPCFAAGTMFWFKPQSLKSLLQCHSIQQDAFEYEQGQIDGTLAHAIERALGCATLSNGYHLCDTRIAKMIGSTNVNIQRQAQKEWSTEWGWTGRKRKTDIQFAKPTQI